MTTNEAKIRVGIVGYGHLGKYLLRAVEADISMELAFVWNRSPAPFADLPQKHRPKILDNLEDFGDSKPDIIVEVAHPDVSKNFGSMFLEKADYFIGSPTALANEETLTMLRDSVLLHRRRAFVPSGALWGAEDIRKMADRGTLKGLEVTMRKHPSCWKLHGELKLKNEQSLLSSSPSVLYEGSVGDLCPLAPNNVNTMAAACISAHNLGFKGVIGRIVADPALQSYHEVSVVVRGPTNDAGDTFRVTTTRDNPSSFGVVTGSATFDSFLSSLKRAVEFPTPPGLHIC